MRYKKLKNGLWKCTVRYGEIKIVATGSFRNCSLAITETIKLIKKRWYLYANVN